MKIVAKYYLAFCDFTLNSAVFIHRPTKTTYFVPQFMPNSHFVLSYAKTPLIPSLLQKGQ